MELSLILSFLLLSSCGGLNALLATRDCQLDRKFIEESNRVLFTHDASGYYKLHLADIVSGHGVLYIACIDKRVVEHVICDPRTGHFVPQLPTTHCSQPKATVKIANSYHGINEYSVGYQIDARTYLELYRTAYNKPAVSALYTVYDGVTGNMITTRPKQDFTTDGVITGAEASSFQSKWVYKRFFDLYGPHQTYVRDLKTIFINIGHLAPSADFLHPHDMRATFKYLNVVPQFSSINRGNWKTIETWVRSVPAKAHVRHLKYRAVTGGLNVLKLAHSSNQHHLIPLYLIDGGKNPVPEWTYKVVEKLNTCTVFVTYNNIFATTIPQPICKQVACPADIKLSTNPKMGYTYCCSAHEFKNQHLRGVHIC